MPLPKERIYTIDDIYSLPDGERAEDEKNNTNYLEPDISVICNKDKLDSKGCHGAPDWTIEIVSPSSRQMDYYKKLTLYQGAGVREYWIIDSAREVVMVYDPANETPPIIYRFTDSVKVNIYENFSIDFSQLKL